ncbi:MAG TPA: TolC family protein, partial [Gemmataceae bacterium]|nr:TolC family protein [Gemmataceae bacterium]
MGESPYRIYPGANVPRLGEGVSSSVTPRAILLGPTNSAGAGTPPYRIPPPVRLTAQKSPQPLYGAIDISVVDEDGPPDGLTLDAAIDRLVQANNELLVKFQEIPKADADILTAGLRNNPLIFASADNVPYGNYSPSRPGETNYSATVIQAIDINRKRLDRIRVAQTAKRVLESQYQDAVRLEIDNLFTAYIDVLRAHATVRYAEVGLKGISEIVELTKKAAAKAVQPKIDVDRALIQQAHAEIALKDAHTALHQAKQTLAVLLNIPADQVDAIALRGSLRSGGAAIAPAEELAAIAIDARPDLVAFRIGVQRAQAEVGLAVKERVTDVYLLYTPYGIRDNRPTGGQNATSWGLSAMVSLPIFNRNQGNIRRAEINVYQTQLELAGLERLVVSEVHKAAQDASSSQAAVDRFEKQILPSAGRIRDAARLSYTQGQESLVSYLNAQRDYNDIANQYLDALARHRRNVLKLNTVVGQRIQP